MNKAVFLDRDGTINFDKNYIGQPEDIELIPGSSEAIKKLNQAGYKVIIISNQAGIARGYMTENALQIVNKKLQKELLNNHAYVDAAYYCPHHADHGFHPYRKDCNCRKPNPGMLQKAIHDHQIDPALSFMIGDKLTDIEAAKRINLKAFLVRTGYGQKEEKEISEKMHTPDKIFDNLGQAVDWILEGIK